MPSCWRVKDKESRVYADPSLIEEIDFRGKFHRFKAIHAVEPSPQRTPVLFQAGGSERGRRFAATHAEGVYLNGTTPQLVAAKVAAIKEELAAVGRSPDSVKFFCGVSMFVDESERAARARYQDYLRYSSFEGLISTMSGIMGIDLSQYPLDEPISYKENDANRSALEMFTRNNDGTLREVLDQKALCGTNVAVVGSPTQVADELEHWMDEGDIDGFNIARIVAHETMENFIELVIPLLQERGRFKTAYRPGTFREKLFGSERISAAGQTPPPPPLPHIPGHEIAGEVAADCGDLRAGQRVACHIVDPCGECGGCRRGYPILCAQARRFGLDVAGGMAKFVAVPRRQVLPSGDGVPYEHAAVAMDSITTPWHALHVTGELAPDEKVVVVAVGGLGINAVQLAVAAGAQVAAVDVSPTASSSHSVTAPSSPSSPTLPRRRSATGRRAAPTWRSSCRAPASASTSPRRASAAAAGSSAAATRPGSSTGWTRCVWCSRTSASSARAT